MVREAREDGIGAHGRSGSTHPGTGSLAKVIGATCIADGKGAKGVDDVWALVVTGVVVGGGGGCCCGSSSLILLYDLGETFPLERGFDTKELVGEERVGVEGVHGVGCSEGIFEISDTTCELRDLLVKILCG